jgi:hypothetical protein
MTLRQDIQAALAGTFIESLHQVDYGGPQNIAKLIGVNMNYTFPIWKNTTSDEVRLWVNDGGNYEICNYKLNICF